MSCAEAEAASAAATEAESSMMLDKESRLLDLGERD